jgi:hypothetical protein
MRRGLNTAIGALRDLLRPSRRDGDASPGAGRSTTGRRGRPGRRTSPRRAPPPAPSATDIGRDGEPLDGVRFEYTPCLDGDPDPGEVVWTWVPYEEDPTQGKDRPVMIIGRHGALLVGVALTSKDRPGADQVPVGTGAWDRDRRPSYAKIDRVLDVVPEQVRREGAIIGRDRYDAVVEAVRRLHR